MKFKPILLYTKHRQTIPILQENKEDFVLIDFDQLWKILRIFGKTRTSKLRAKVYFVLLKVLKPEIILDINWIGRVAMIHHLYSKKYNVKLVAVQHGFYTGGHISNRFPEGRWHKMARCTHFWIWSDCIKSEVVENRANFIVNGNPLYNTLFGFKNPYRKIEKVETILILPTSFVVGDEQKLDKLNYVIDCLVLNGYQVYIKFHHMNQIFPNKDQVKILENIDVYSVLLKQEFDLVIADHSTTLLDALFFNNFVSFCNFHQSSNTLYEKFLGELNVEFIEDEMIKIISSNRIEQQTNFLNYLGLNGKYSNSILDNIK